jgi:hypothetical protein
MSARQLKILREAEIQVIQALTDEQLVELLGDDVMPDLDDFTLEEIESLINDTAGPDLIRRFKERDAEAQAKKA